LTDVEVWREGFGWWLLKGVGAAAGAFSHPSEFAATSRNGAMQVVRPGLALRALREI